MGNRSSAPLPATAQLEKRFTPAELRRAAAHHQGGPALTREQFLSKFGEGMGPAMRRVLLRLFAVLDANGSGALEPEEHLAAAFFYTKATPAERQRVLFSMYDSASSSSSSSSSAAAAGSSSSSLSSSSSSYLSKNDVAALCSETTFALAELQPAPPSILKQLGADGGNYAERPRPAVASIDAAASTPPFRELTSVLVDVAFAKYDTDRDGRLSFSEFQAFAQHVDSGVETVLQSLVAAPYARQLWPPER